MVVGAAVRVALRPRGGRVNPGTLGEGFADFWTRPWRGVLRGAWGWFAVVVVLVVFNTVLGEELLFRGFCCRECRAFSEGATGSPTGCSSRSTTCISRGDSRPLVDIFALAYPSRRFQSAWMGIIVTRFRASSSLG